MFAGAASSSGSAHAVETEPPLPPRRPAAPPPTPALAPVMASPAPLPEKPSDASGDCLALLKAQGAIVEPAKLAAQADPRCAIAQPVTLASLALANGRRVDLPDRPTLDCATAATFASFISEALAPLAKGAFDTWITAIGTGPGFDCRTRDHIADAKLSAHAHGLAIDIASIKFANGRVYLVGKLADSGERAFDHAARAAACGYFHTALGPGSDFFHSSHWHVDLEVRGGDGKAKFCQ